MLTIYHIRLLIDECRGMSLSGLLYNTHVMIPQLEIDIAMPNDFLGVHNNPAIFVNSITFKQLNKYHKNWVENKTLVFKKSFLEEKPITIIGAVVHETGHAFNVAANIPNTEANAYIYEIEVMRALLSNESPLLFGCTFTDMQEYFQKRIAFYSMDTTNNTQLQELIASIKFEFKLSKEEEELKPEIQSLQPNPISSFLKNRESLFSEHEETQPKPEITESQPEKLIP